MYPRLKQKEVEAFFTLADIKVLAVKELIDGYGYSAADERFYTTLPRCAWYFVKTPYGWIEIGWRKNVMSIDWKDTLLRKKLDVKEQTTSEVTYIHAWEEEKALKYLKLLSQELKELDKKPENFPAFPVAYGERGWTNGMTLRDYFAGQALIGIISKGTIEKEWYAYYTDDAYEIADQMLKRRQQ